MRRALAIIALAACNQAWGIDPTTRLDAPHPFFDAPSDAAPTCPSGSAPRFSLQLHQTAVNTACYAYALSATGIVLARCRADWMEGILDEDLVPARGFAGIDQVSLWGYAVAPSGGETLVATIDNAVGHLRVFRRDASGAWIAAPELPIAVGYNDQLVGVTPHPDPHVLMLRSDGMHEYAESTGWGEVANQSLADLGFGTDITAVRAPHLSPGGLALTVRGVRGSAEPTYYLHRPSLAAAWEPAQLVESLPGVDGTLTDDCGRFYFTGLSTVFYAQQQ